MVKYTVLVVFIIVCSLVILSDAGKIFHKHRVERDVDEVKIDTISLSTTEEVLSTTEKPFEKQIKLGDITWSDEQLATLILVDPTPPPGWRPRIIVDPTVPPEWRPTTIVDPVSPL